MSVSLPHLRRVRWLARGILLAGVAVATAANMVEAAPHPVAWLLGALPPVALVACVELTCLAPARQRWIMVARSTATALVAAVAAVMSYESLAGVGARFGEPSYVVPTAVVGAVAVASLSLVEISRRVRESERAAAEAAAKPGRAGVLALVGRTGARGAAAIVAPPTYVNGLIRRPPPSVSA